MTVRRAIACMAVVLAVGALGAARASAQEPGLRYFGYFAARITAAGGNHLAEVSARSNLNWVQISDPDRYAPEVLDGCASHGCIISTGNEFFRGCDSVHSPTCELYPDYAARWNRLADAVRSRIDKVGAFYLMDEPQWRGATVAELRQAAEAIKATYPSIPVMMVEAGPQVSASLQVPGAVDWVGFDWYCRPFADVERTLATLGTRIHPGQSMFLVPEAAPLQACGGAAGHATDAEIAALQYDYLHLAGSDPRVIGLLAFGFWTSGYGSADLPQTVAAHTDIFNRIAPPAGDLGAAAEIAGRRARINRRGIVRVRLRCPQASAQRCAGELSLQCKRRRGSLGSAPFELSPSRKTQVRVRVLRRERRRLLKQSGRGDGVKIRAAATTAAGTVEKNLTLRRRGRRR